MSEAPVLHVSVHDRLLAYCSRIGITPKTFGQVVVKSTAFAARLRVGKALVGSVSLAARFMDENPEVPRREFGLIARAWLDRIATADAEDAVQNGVAHTGSGGCGESVTDATLEQVDHIHNQESQSTAEAVS